VLAKVDPFLDLALTVNFPSLAWVSGDSSLPRLNLGFLLIGNP